MSLYSLSINNFTIYFANDDNKGIENTRKLPFKIHSENPKKRSFFFFCSSINNVFVYFLPDILLHQRMIMELKKKNKRQKTPVYIYLCLCLKGNLSKP